MTMRASNNKTMTLKQNMLWNSFGSLSFLGCQWLITILVVRLSGGYEAAGMLSLAMSVYNIFSSIAVYRMYTYQVSDVRHENSVGEYYAFRVITCLIALALIICYSALTCPREAMGTIVVYAIYRMANLLIDILHGLDQLNGRMDYIGKSLAMQGLASLVIFCVIQCCGGGLMVAFIAMTFGIVAIGVFFDLPRASAFEDLNIGISFSKTKYLLCHCLGIVVAAVALGLAPSIPRQILSFFDGADALGIYSSVAAPITIIQMGACYIYNPLLGYVSDAFYRRQYSSLRRLLFKAAGGILAIGVAGAAIFAFLGEPLLILVFGEGIAQYSYLMMPIIACSIITAFVWFLNDILVSLRCFKGSFFGGLCSALLCIPLSFFFVNQFGMNGVSFAHSISYAASALVMLAMLLKLVRGNDRA